MFNWKSRSPYTIHLAIHRQVLGFLRPASREQKVRMNNPMRGGFSGTQEVFGYTTDPCKTGNQRTTLFVCRLIKHCGQRSFSAGRQRQTETNLLCLADVYRRGISLSANGEARLGSCNVGSEIATLFPVPLYRGNGIHAALRYPALSKLIRSTG